MQSGTQSQGAPVDVVDPLLGRVLNDRFRILEVLGSGGMGRVYKAVQAPLDRLVALKVLNPSYGEGRDPGFQKRFFLEASVTSKLRHPATVTVIDYGKTDDGIYYIAMEYLEGQTLAQLLTQVGPLPWQRAFTIIQQVARSLREAHKVGLIHRDLKPANVMVLNQETDHDVVKVLDFGLVKSFLPDKEQNSPELTQAGVILGSPQYMAPEQARNISDPRSDVYSLGVVLYQMLTGRPPFQAAQSLDVIFKHINEAPPAFSAIWPAHAIPPEAEAVVMKCLAKRPDERFQSMDEVLEALRRAASSAGYSGAFSGPRTTTGSGPISGPTAMPGSGPHARPGSGPISGPHAQGSPSGANTVALDIAVVEPTPQAPKPRRLLPWVLFGGSLLVGLGVVAMGMLRAPPPEQPPPVEPVATPTPPPVAAQKPPPPPVQPPPVEPVATPTPTPPQPQVVRFLLASEPSGAQVVYGGRPQGRTPVSLELPADAQGHATVQVTFLLEGYQRATATFEGDAPEARFTQKLKKKSSRSPGSEGYKDDPYQ